MAVDDELRWLDATDTARLVAAGDVSAREVVEAAIRRVEEQPSLNAVVIPLFEEALERADTVDRSDPCAGVPFLLKDVGAHQAGQPQYLGNETLKDHDRQTPCDSDLGARYRAAGLVTIGKSNTPEFGIYGDTDNPAFGATINPWDHERSTSGSSGGSAAAVAAGLVPIAHGNDAGGSIRTPAAWCGVVGFKPSSGRTPACPGWEAAFFCVEHVLTRTVRDTARALDVSHGPHPAELFHAPVAAPSFADAVASASSNAPLRVGLLVEAHVEIAADVRAAVEATGRALEAAGHHVEVSQPRGLFAQERFLHLGFIGGFSRNSIAAAFASIDAEPDPERLGPVARAAWSNPQATAAQVADDVQWWVAWRRRISTWWDDFDVLVTPTTGVTAQTHEDVAPDPAAPMMKMFTTLAPVMAFGQIFNMSGQPAISLPVAVSDEGLPIGVQLVGGFGRDDVVLAVAAQLEAALPWADRHPPVQPIS